MARDRVLLAHMPMGLVQVPNLGLSLLSAGLRRVGRAVDVRYYNVEYLDRFFEGEDLEQRYVWLVDQPRLAYLGASYFSELRWPDDPVRDELRSRFLARTTAGERDLLGQIARTAGAFIEHCLATTDWERYAVVGFTTLFAGMTEPSMALARRIKELHPHVTTVIGGWNTNGEMGEAIAEKFADSFDYVLRGEGDLTFPTFVDRILAGESPDGIPGLVRLDRATGRVAAWPQVLLEDVDALPYPDFDDFFATVETTRFRERYDRVVHIPFESSRGCWWGEKSHCKFCGLNGLGMPFRSKSPARIRAEIDHLVARHRPAVLFAADMILDNRYVRELLPELRDVYPGTTFAYELKAPVRRRQVEVLAGANVREVTVGIESLSTRVLALMRKGVTFLQNVHCLRLAEEYGLNVGWQHLFGFPEETLEDYLRVIDHVPRLVHLRPPQQACAITLARFSPYYDRARENRLGRIRAHRDYRLCYPWADEDLRRVAYHFEFEYEDGRAAELMSEIGERMGGAVEGWQRKYGRVRLDQYAGSRHRVVVDTRFQVPSVYLLEGAAATIYEMIDDVHSADWIARSLPDRHRPDLTSLLGLPAVEDEALYRLAETEARRLDRPVVRVPSPFPFGLPDSTEARALAVREFLDRLVEAGLALEEDGRWVALAVTRSSVPEDGEPEAERPIEMLGSKY